MIYYSCRDIIILGGIYMYQDWMKDYNEIVFGVDKKESADNDKEQKESNN